MEKYEEAIKYYKEALDMRLEMTGKNNIDYALT